MRQEVAGVMVALIGGAAIFGMVVAGQREERQAHEAALVGAEQMRTCDAAKTAEQLLLAATPQCSGKCVNQRDYVQRFLAAHAAIYCLKESP